jgi:hypothetical protein
MTEYTAHFRLPIPDFNQEPWHDQFRTLCVALDTMAHDALLSQSADWMNSTLYPVGTIVLDTVNGLLYVSTFAHTSPATPTTFAQYRAANPTHWNQIAQIPQQRGSWQTATTYTVGDFVVDTNRYAVCIVSHVSTVFNTDVGAGKWSILIDFSSLSVGINALTEVSITAAPTTDLNLSSATQMLINGTGITITSFGSGANLYKVIRFNGANTITHNATSLILLGGENRLTVSGDVMFLRSDISGNWRELFYWTKSTEISRGVVELATSAETVTGSDAVRATHPAGIRAFFDQYIPSGTKVMMRQTTPPVGWTKELTHNDKALRVVSGSIVDNAVGSSFSTLFGAAGTTVTGGTTLIASQIPTHKHFAFINDPGHSQDAVGTGGATPTGHPTAPGTVSPGNVFTGVRVWDLGTLDQTAGSVGSSGGSHNHPMDIRTQYIDVITAVRV